METVNDLQHNFPQSCQTTDLLLAPLCHHIVSESKKGLASQALFQFSRFRFPNIGTLCSDGPFIYLKQRMEIHLIRFPFVATFLTLDSNSKKLLWKMIAVSSHGNQAIM